MTDWSDWRAPHLGREGLRESPGVLSPKALRLSGARSIDDYLQLFGPVRARQGLKERSIHGLLWETASTPFA